MKPIPWWSIASAVTAPVLLIGGWTLAAALQPAGYDPIRDTISALAAYGARDRWVMTFALVGLGLCHATTALGLRPARTVGRAMLAGGGIATIGVGAFAQPAHGNSVGHTIAAAIAFTALGAWPIFAGGHRGPSPVLRRSTSLVAAAFMLGLAIWFVVEVHGGERGIAERAAAGAQALWPLAVVVTTRRALAPAGP